MVGRMSTTWMAEERVVFVFPDGTRHDGRIGVGLPVQRDEDAQCPVVLEGLEPTRSIYGDTTLQALLLGIRFLGMRLNDFLSRGGRVLYPEGANEGDVDVVLDALFGPLLRHPEPGTT